MAIYLLKHEQLRHANARSLGSQAPAQIHESSD